MSKVNESGKGAIAGEQLDEMFDNGEDVLDYFDMDHAVVEHHPPLEKRVTFTMPAWMVSELDKEASELAISRNAVVNTWIAERLRRDRRRVDSTSEA
nr:MULTISPECIES: antitoxin [Bifidobacterium]